MDCKRFATSAVSRSVTHISHTCSVVCACSLGEAIDKAIENHKKHYPESEGHRGHNANGMPILGDCPLPCPMASTSRPDDPRKDERTVDGRSEYRAKLATLVEQVVKRWGPDVIEFKKQDGRSEEGEEG